MEHSSTELSDIFACTSQDRQLGQRESYQFLLLLYFKSQQACFQSFQDLLSFHYTMRHRNHNEVARFKGKSHPSIKTVFTLDNAAEHHNLSIFV